MSTLKIQIENIHCSQCEKYLASLLSQFFNLPSYLRGNVLSNRGEESWQLQKAQSIVRNRKFEKLPVTAYRVDRNAGLVTIGYVGGKDSASLCHKVKLSLADAGFAVVDAYLLGDLESLQSKTIERKSKNILSWVGNTFFGNRDMGRQRDRTHLEYCEYCRSHKTNSGQEASKFHAKLAIEGMTCASCTQSIKRIIKEHVPGTETIALDLLSGIAKFTVEDRQMLQSIVESIRDSGYQAKIIEVVPIIQQSRYKIVAAIGGITCAACASAITNAVQGLPFVEEVAINVVSKTGIFILDSNDASKLHELKGTIEDTGFDLEQIGPIELVDHASIKKVCRNVILRVDGMYCLHCPERVNSVLKNYRRAKIDIQSPITLKNPFIRFSYFPNVEEDITIRSIINSLMKEISLNSDNNFKITIVQELTLDEHLKKAAKKQVMHILIRLTATTLIAIPTFVFGVVGMSLLQNKNGFRRWLNEPLWHGEVARMVWILFILSTLVYFFIDDIFHRKALKEVRALWLQKNNWKRRILKFGSMNLLMSLGTSVAYFASVALLAIGACKRKEHNRMPDNTTYFDSVVFLTFFLLIGRLLECFSKSKSAAAITNLSSMKQNSAKLLEKHRSGQISERIVDIKYLEIGDLVKISPGDSPPADCIITDGETQFDESALTGESIPVAHFSGELVFTGTINVGRNTVMAKLISQEGDSLLDQIVNTVRDGQLKKAPVEKLADALTGYFVPIIVFLAVITWVIWLSLGYSRKLPRTYLDKDLGGWAVWSLEFAISVFVVACPCGIGLAAPTALFVGSGLAAKHGILVKGGGAAFQECSQTSVVCFDKTGTLTKGSVPDITDYSIHGNSKIRAIVPGLVRDLEANSRHPLAVGVSKFIADHFRPNGSNKIPVTEEVAGKGMMGEILSDTLDGPWSELNPERIILGNERFMSDNQVSLTSDHLRLLNHWKVQGKSVIIVAISSPTFFQKTGYFPVMLMAARDEIRPEAKDVIRTLQSWGLECWMISGDNELTARSIAKELGINQVVAEVLPHEKAEKVQWIQQTYKRHGKPAVVAMVGDGINDAPAMATADVGIALTSGSDLAVTSSDFVLLSTTQTLKALLILFQLSKKVFRRVRFNFAWALVYNMIAVPIAAGVIYPYKHARLSPVWASAAMAMSSVSVILSSLALKLYKPGGVNLSKEDITPTNVVEHRFN
ncbi:related to cation transport ATPase [Zygosaccharomyces bailii ISA1307]|nr:related to cation transport ATPase [Zygosaccharomyces bailii ISA1307]